MKPGVIVGLLVFIVATSTSVLADCGWILWYDLQVIVGGDSGQKEWTVAGTAKTFEQCTALLRRTQLMTI